MTKERRITYQLQKRCYNCSTQDTRTLEGRSTCIACYKKQKEWTQKRFVMRRSLGLCVCGNKLLVDYKRCQKCQDRIKTYLKENKAKIAAKCKERYWNNREKYLEKRHKYAANLRAQVIQEYGSKCVCCGETTPEFLQIDHINNDGAQHRRENKSSTIYEWLKSHNFPKDNFQLLCANCNWSRGIYGGCPHARSK